MSKSSLLTLFTHPSLAHSLQPALKKLMAGAVISSLSGLAMLAALWCLTQLLEELSPFWIAMAIGLWLLGSFSSALASWLAHDGESTFSARLRRQIANHLVRLPNHSLAKHSDQSLRDLVSNDVEKLHHMVAHLPAEAANFVIVPLAAIALLVHMAGLSALWALLPGILASLYYLIVVPHINARDGQARMKVMGEIITAVDDYSRGIRVNRIYGRQSGALAAYDDATKRFTNSMVMWVSKVATLAGMAVALLQAVATFAIAYLITFDANIETQAATIFFSLAIVTPALRLGHGLDYVSTGKGAMGRIISLLEQAPLPTGKTTSLENTSPLTLTNAQMSIDDVPLQSPLNFTFKSGAVNIITGPSGVGKTTLLHIIAGQETLQSGQITLAQTDIQQLNELTRHKNVLLIPQGSDVLPATVAENLRLTAPNASDSELEAGLQRAQLNIPLETSAVILSGGERQRLGLARAFLSDAKIILLDEPTSALDSTKVERLMVELKHLAEEDDKTIIMITHDETLAVHAATKLELNRTMTSENQQ
ncbi:ATP-binding cassette domain-containing protein [Marinomonas mediterranea]|uniref:ATP-binding cassette domain-containing protein n=1 Tax=Marinomonas mediterranea TaxID=119864 RepID=UPI00234BF61A|nr:ABC transporter ATP-binding protein [Marinomonas mediterranea]WCN09918.1 ATP-binding cassette domain-containing protein [Marinomonas mediterranea]